MFNEIASWRCGQPSFHDIPSSTFPDITRSSLPVTTTTVGYVYATVMTSSTGLPYPEKLDSSHQGHYIGVGVGLSIACFFLLIGVYVILKKAGLTHCFLSAIFARVITVYNAFNQQVVVVENQTSNSPSPPPPPSPPIPPPLHPSHFPSSVSIREVDEEVEVREGFNSPIANSAYITKVYERTV